MKYMQHDSQQFVKELGKAGGGISVVKRTMATYLLFPLLNRLLSWDKAWEIYDKEGQKILDLTVGLTHEQLFRRVLIPPLFGLEDNSRYYSVAMVTEHLLSVGTALMTRIPLLSRGEKLGRNVQITDVKPYKEIDEHILGDFAEFLASYRVQMENDIGDIHIDNTSAHPWFGEFNPKQWSVLGMVHQIVHRRQIEAILRQLR